MADSSCIRWLWKQVSFQACFQKPQYCELSTRWKELQEVFYWIMQQGNQQKLVFSLSVIAGNDTDELVVQINLQKQEWGDVASVSVLILADCFVCLSKAKLL